MRFDRDKLIFMSLAVLDDVCARTLRGTVAPSLSIRLALAVLYGYSQGDKAMFQEFWNQMRNPCDSANTYKQANTIRHTYTRRAFNGIARLAGVDLDIEYEGRLASLRKKGPPVPP